MKKLLLFIFTISFVNALKSQAAFCKPGAKWNYLFYTGLDGGLHNGDMTYVSDTIVGADTIKIITYNSFFTTYDVGRYCNSVAIKQRGDTVFMRNCNTSGTWQILYNFACTPNQYWITTVKDSLYWGSTSKITYTTVVNSVSTVTMNNVSLKKMNVIFCYLSNTGTQCDTATIYERIGCSPYLFYYKTYTNFNDDNAVFWGFHCYKDNTFGPVAFSPNGCDLYSVGIKENSFNSSEVSIYPNPVNDHLNIDLGTKTNGELTAGFTDITGRAVKQLKLGQTKNKLDVKGLSNGLYLLTITDQESKILYQTKVLKQE